MSSRLVIATVAAAVIMIATGSAIIAVSYDGGTGAQSDAASWPQTTDESEPTTSEPVANEPWYTYEPRADAWPAKEVREQMITLALDQPSVAQAIEGHRYVFLAANTGAYDKDGPCYDPSGAESCASVEIYDFDTASAIDVVIELQTMTVVRIDRPQFAAATSAVVSEAGFAKAIEIANQHFGEELTLIKGYHHTVGSPGTSCFIGNHVCLHIEVAFADGSDATLFVDMNDQAVVHVTKPAFH